MADFAGYHVDGVSDEELLDRALAIAARMTPERIETSKPAGSAEETATFPFGDEVIRSNYGKLPGVREALAAMRVAGALGKGAIEGGTQAVTATGRALKGEIAPERMQEEALNTAMTIGGAGLGLAGNVSRMTPNQLQMFFGPKAATADLKALDRAKQLEKMGAGIGRIRKEGGGWFKGGDGEWRYEVPDDGLKVDAEGFRVEHPEIAKAYPGMLDSFTTIVDDVNPARPSNMGSWDAGSRTMRIFSKDPAERRSIAGHELQHIIDHHEGRAPGMGVEDPQIGYRLMEPKMAMAKDIAQNRAKSDLDWFDSQHIAPLFAENLQPKVGEAWENLGRADRAHFRNKIMKDFESSIPKEAVDGYWGARDILADGPTSPFSHYGQYQREVGEVGARNVQTRLDWTPTQRRALHPQLTEDIPRDQQWVAKRAPEYAWNELPDGDAVSRALDVAASRPVESLVYRAGDELSPEGSSGYQAVPGKPSVVTIPGYGKVEARPVQPLLDAAESYMRSVGRPGEHDVAAFPKLDEDRAARIAEAYARMRHDPTDPKVAKAYDAMADETMEQYRKLRDQGLDFHFLRDGEPDPYARSPSLGYPDLIKNGRLSVFPTEQGFGSNELFDPSANPLLKKVGKVGDLENATVNDAFRAVHDAHGRFGPGNPFFRAPGEERAWYAHSRMYSPEAVPAMTSETRGQNSWLNFGPHAAHNKTALGADTIFADQKTGLMDDWTWALDPEALYPRRAAGGRVTGARVSLLEPEPVRRALDIAYEDHPARIPQRIPRSPKPLDDPNDDLLVDRAALEKTPKLFEKNVNLVKAYPNTPVALGRLGSKKTADAFIDHVKSNLLWLHDQYAPEVRGRAKLWYVGANKIANDWAKEFDLPVASVSGVLASLSPQKDWFKNVSLARRVLDTYHGPASQQPATPEMMAKLEAVFPAAEYPTAHATVAGKTLHELDTPAKKAMWIRLYDEAHNDRSHRIVSPEGTFGDVRTKKDGTPTVTGWGSIPEIARAVGSLESNGDRSKLSKLMGEQHKVRNFFNNILSPNSSRGDVTIDTHAIAAGLLRPLSGASTEVKHNFGEGSGGSDLSGVQGLYPLYAEAYRQAAKERGILPREMQSITWEAVRGLFPDTIKKKGNKTVAAIDATWHKYRNGELSLDDTRSAVHDLAGGIKNPDWFRPGVAVAAPDGDPAHAGELDQDGSHGQAPGGLGSGAGVGAAGGPSEADAPDLTDYLAGRVQRARGGRIRSIGAMATRWSPRPALMPDIDRDPVSDALAAMRRRF